MPTLAIIPAAAVSDPRLTDRDIRVLCAIGTFTNRLGGNVWASIETLAIAANLSTRTVQRAIQTLAEAQYLRRIDRPGTTALLEVVLQPADGVTGESGVGVTTQSGGGDYADGGGVTTQSPKRYKERYKGTIYPQVQDDPDFQRGLETIWHTYPKRPEPYPFVALRSTLADLVHTGTPMGSLVLAAQRYAQKCQQDRTEPKYVKHPLRFYTDSTWQAYTEATVYGRTRDEWARSGQDVTEFDRLAGSPA